MVGSKAAVKKLWKSALKFVSASRRVVKEKVKKKRFRIVSSKRSREKNGHYSFSDDNETTSRFRKRVRKWKIKAMACMNGSSDIESGNTQFVYLTDLYHPPPSFTVDCYGEGIKSEKANKENHDGICEEPCTGFDAAIFAPSTGNQTFGRCGDVETKAEGCSSSGAFKTELKEWEKDKRKKIDMRVFGKEVDGDADLFIAKFYDEMELQRQKSIVEYWEMLDRGTTST